MCPNGPPTAKCLNFIPYAITVLWRKTWRVDTALLGSLRANTSSCRCKCANCSPVAIRLLVAIESLNGVLPTIGLLKRSDITKIALQTLQTAIVSGYVLEEFCKR